MQAIMPLTTTFMLLLLLLSSIEYGYVAASAECPDCHSQKYNTEKETIDRLLAETSTGGYLLTDFLQNFTVSPAISNANDQKALISLITDLKNAILANDTYSNQEKLAKSAVQIDKLFLHYPALENAIRFEIIQGPKGEWGPLCDMLFIVDEYNIGKFWEIVSTPGTVTPCRFHDLILTNSKDNYMIQRGLYLKNIYCSKSFDTATEVVNIDSDFDEFEDDQLYLKSLELQGYDMTVNQVQRVARAYYSSKAISCRRLRDTWANFDATVPRGFTSQSLQNALSAANDNGVRQKSAQFCVEFFSKQVALLINDSANYYKIFNAIFWNPPYGSLYDNIIYNECQISSLKANALEYYN